MRTANLTRGLGPLALMFLVQCSGRQPTGSSEGPFIELSAASRSFVAQEGGANPAEQTVAITSSGSGSLTDLTARARYAAGQEEGWLDLALDGGSAPTTLRLRPSNQGLAPGEYQATVTVASPAAEESRTLSVSLTVSPAAGTLVITPLLRNLTATQGGSDPEPQIFEITNGGGGTLTGLAGTVSHPPGEATGWLSFVLSSTTAPATLTAMVDIRDLTPGIYHGAVRITSPAAGNSPQFLGVSVTIVAPQPMIQLDPSSVSFTVTAGANPAPRTVQVSSGNVTPLRNLSTAVTYSTGQTGGWLQAALDRTTSPATLTLTPSSSSLAPGTYNATASVLSPGASNTPQAVAVTLTVTAPLIAPVLQVPAVTGTTVKLTWTYGWSGLGSSGDGYRVESSASPSSGFSEIYSVASHDSPFTLTINNHATGTRYYRVRALTTQGFTPYSAVRAVTVGTSARLTIRNQLSPGGGDKVLRLRIADTQQSLFSAANPAAERLSPDNYCGGLPGVSIDVGEAMTFDVGTAAPDYYLYIGLGDWDASTGGSIGCWHKKNWAFDGTNLLYLHAAIRVTGHTGDVQYTLVTLPNGALVVRTPSGDISMVASVNQDPIR